MELLPAPTMFTREPMLGYLTPPADLHVSPDGDDRGDGSMASPFATLERAREEARAKTAASVAVHGGVYNIAGFTLDENDSGCTYFAYGDGEAVLCGGVKLRGEDFTSPDDAFRARLSGEAADRVVCVDLTKYGLSKSDWGEIHAIGAFNVAAKYDGDTVGTNCELFWNDRRLTLARYPNEGFLKLDAVADVGDVCEFPPQNYRRDWDERRNHRGGEYVIDRDTNARASKWLEPEKAWMFGYFFWDWADASTPIAEYLPKIRAVKPAYCSRYGARAGADYYFFNVPEELDIPGEWYLDRDTGMLYVYPPSDISTADIELSITEKPLISLKNAENVLIQGFTLLCTRGNAVEISGKGNRLSKCVIKNVLGNAVTVSGTGNIVRSCDISHTGRGGISISGGDRPTLTRGDNYALCNLIHDWSEVYLTYQAAISLHGVGNTAAHNEIFNSPQLAISYGGNDNVIEYNIIHDVVLQSTDGGAIYAGYNWTAQGNIIRFNALWNIGAGKHRPDGIYWDDSLSGQTAYGNILINVAKNSFLIGGGRDNKIFDNIIINGGEAAISYDDRARDGFVHDGWARCSVNDRKTSGLWTSLDAMPYRSELWAKRYPTLAKVKDSFDTDPDDPDFPINPSYVEVRHNLVFDDDSSLGRIAKSVYDYGEVRDNIVYALTDADTHFADPDKGDYSLKDGVDFPEPPYSEMGIHFS